MESDPVNWTDSSGLIVDTAADIMFILYDLYRLISDGSCGFGDNMAALGADVAGMFLPGVTGMGMAVRAAKETTVIGRVKDLQRLKQGEKSLLDRLPDMGNPKANWKQNSSVLRQEMAKKQPIRDASPNDKSGQFLNAERALLKNRGWTFDGHTNYWMPPK